MTTNQSEITQNLSNFYTAEAEKFYNTRKKNIRPEFEHILYQINTTPKDKIYVLELGCGDGRFYNFLKQYCEKEFDYIGVDVSEGLIKLAKTNYPETERQVADMLQYTSDVNLANQYDIVVSIAAVQHIYTLANRVRLSHNIYNITQYEGKFIMTNWSLSHRFIKKYYKILRKSLLSRLLGTQDMLDLYIPRQSIDGDKKTYDRYYHIFLPSEIRNICLQSNWIIDKLGYIDNRGNFTKERKESRNTFLVASKDVVR